MKELFKVLQNIKDGVKGECKKPITKKSKYKYIYWDINVKKWTGQFYHKGKSVYVGANGNQYKLHLKVKEARCKLNLK